MVFGTDLSAWKRVPFADSHEIHEAQNSPLYKTSEAYRAAFADKLAISSDQIGPQAHVGRGPNQIYGRTPDGGSLEESGLDPADFASITPSELQEYADQMGEEHPLALDYKSLKITPRPRPAPPKGDPFPVDQKKVGDYLGRLIENITNTGNDEDGAA